MIALLLAWAQQQATHGLSFTGDEVRTWLLGIMTAMGGFGLRYLRAAIQRLDNVGQDVRDMKRDVHEHTATIALHGKRLNRIEARNIAIDAVVQAEQEEWPHPDRRRHRRRLRDVIHELHEPPVSDEHPTTSEGQ